ncbi:hypothetical protein J6W34_00290 [bacterium]|nr:hypothetical protein [bacterium]
MIYVDTLYLKKDGTEDRKTHEFGNVIKALRFMYGCYSHNLWIESFRCDDPLDYVALSRRVCLIDLNTGKKRGGYKTI